MAIDLGDDFSGQRHLLEVVDREQAGAQAVVDVVRVIGDVVGEGGDLRLERGVAPELEVVGPVVVGDPDRKAAVQVAAGRRTVAFGQRAVVLDDPLERFPVRFSPPNSG